VDGDLARGKLAVTHEAQDGATSRIGDRSQRLVHGDLSFDRLRGALTAATV
jgi:hypothetical protein